MKKFPIESSNNLEEPKVLKLKVDDSQLFHYHPIFHGSTAIILAILCPSIIFRIESKFRLIRAIFHHRSNKNSNRLESIGAKILNFWVEGWA